MATHRNPLSGLRRHRFDVGVCLLGLALLTWSATAAAPQAGDMVLTALVCVPLIAVVARFPMVLDSDDGGIEIGFDSCVLIFLLCIVDPEVAVTIWGLGVLVTQLTSGKRFAALSFNVGIGVLAGGASAGVFHLVRGPGEGTPREVVAVVAAAATYFIVDYVVSAVSVAKEAGVPASGHLARAGALTAFAVFIPLDLLGYLAAVVYRTSPWWTLALLAVPLGTLLIATRAVTRGREDTRRLTVLLEAAVRLQGLHEPGPIGDAILHDARRLLRLKNVELRDSLPLEHEIGAQVRRGKEAAWVVAPARERARSTTNADHHALDALAVLGSDAFARIQLTADMVHYARHDPLTDLPNRGILLDRVAHALQLARRHERCVALLFVDLDGFKPVNDRFGHAAGDAVLVEVAKRLISSTRDSDTVARLGGDEFAVLLEDVTSEDVFEISDRILASLSKGTHVDAQPVSVAASIGIAFGDGSEPGEALLRHADLAMYEAKNRGKAQAVAYEPTIGRARLEGLELAEDLRRAIDAGELEVAYQPVVATRTGQIVGVEALARWNRAGKEVAPQDFVRLAESTGLVVSLGELMLSNVASDAERVRAVGGPSLSMSVNVSARQLRDPAFVSVVERTVQSMDDTPLILEITEREGVADDSLVMETMRVISDLGVRFAIDDFGVGFSSISYLHTVPAHVVKIDGTLAQDIDHDEQACAVLTAMVTMGTALGLDVVVEGVERQGQLDKIRDEAHATMVQGFLLHRPMPLDALLDVLRAARGSELDEPRPPPAAPGVLAPSA